MSHLLHRHWRGMRLRTRLVWGITLLQVLLMSALVIDLLLRQHESLHNQGLSHASTAAQALAASSASWVMANDLAGLQEVTTTIATSTHMRYVMVLAPDGRVLAHSDPQRVGQYADDPISQSLRQHPAQLTPLARNHFLEDVAAPVMAGTSLLAWARVGIDQDVIRHTIVRTTLQGLLYIGLGALASYGLAWLLARWLTGGLQRLHTSFQRVRSGERGFRVSTPYQDEVSRLGEGFNQMLADLEAHEARLQAQAATDPLTSLHNRRSLMQQLAAQLTRVQHGVAPPTALLMLDLDHFKRVNDQFGHLAGDAVLRQFAQTMQTSLRNTDICGRLGGEEFAVFLPATDLPTAERLADRLRQNVAQTDTPYEAHRISVTVSIGITLLHADDPTPEAALERADQALYRAKSSGRNRVEVQG